MRERDRNAAPRDRGTGRDVRVCAPRPGGTLRLGITFGAILTFSSLAAAADGLYRRDLACASQPAARATEICHALERALEWTWTGHAMLSPGYRIEAEGVRDVFCSLPVTAADTESLVAMVLNSDLRGGMRDLQLNNGARSLLWLLGERAIERFPALDASADESRRTRARHLRDEIKITLAEDSPSIYNPKHEQYLLRGGCR